MSLPCRRILENRSISTGYHHPMRLLEALASAFINIFGITQPTEKTRRRAAWFIFCLLLMVLALLIVGATVLLRIL